MTNDEYVLMQGTKCPFCESCKVIVEDLKHSPKRPHIVTSRCHCDECNDSWIDEYQLARFKKIK